MLLVPSLTLLASLPHTNAMKSFGSNRHAYESEFWELQYQAYRYLGRMSDADLVVRHESIIRNMKALLTTDRDIIPIQSFLSSWFWFRKKHQTRLEFLLRGISVPAPPDAGSLTSTLSAAPIRPLHPNAADVLFRYGQRKDLSSMLSDGAIRIGPASHYKNMQGDLARFDEECSKTSLLPGQHTRVTTMDGRNIPVIGDVSRSVSAPNYYALCMSCDWDLSLFDDFGADCCVIIKDPETFAVRLETTFAPVLPGWYFHHNPVEYFDPYETTRNGYFDATMCKDFRFAYQREYRFLWFSQQGEEAGDFKFGKVGSLGDIAELHGIQEADAQQPLAGDVPQAARP
jgi:hypothetical protein